MTLLFGAIVSLLIELIKKIFKNKKLVRPVLVILAFILSLVASGIYAYLAQNFDLTALFAIWASAIAFYEIILKTVLFPLFDKLRKKD